jgi:hypothetical protein
MQEVMDQDTGYVQQPPLLLDTPLIAFLILEVRIHVPGGKEKDDNLGDHLKIKKRGGPPDVVAVLETEFRARRGRVVVSGKNLPTYPCVLARRLTMDKCVPSMPSATLPACICSAGWTNAFGWWSWISSRPRGSRGRRLT